MSSSILFITIHQVLSSSSPLSILCPDMESKVLRKKITTSLLWLLVLSAAFLLFTLHSSNPFIITSKQSLNQIPLPSVLTTTTTPPSSLSPSEIARNEAIINQSPPLFKVNGTMSSNPSPSNPQNISFKAAQIQIPPLSEGDNATTPTPPPSSSNPFSIISNETLDRSPRPTVSRNQSSPFSESNNSSMSIVQNISNGGGEATCDVFSGKWVREPRGSIYTNWTCPTLPVSKNCGMFGKDQGHVYWRWKPEGCDLPRFDPLTFLNVVRGKKLAFIGDSLARNQMESLLCLLSQAETPVAIYKDEKDRLMTWHFRTWYFPHHDFTLMAIRTQFLVEGTETIRNGTNTGTYDIHLDKVDTKWAGKLPGVHYAVISGGNWFFRELYMYEGGELIGCFLCKEAKLLGLEFVVRRVFRTSLQYLRGCVGCEGLVTLLRTYSPSHFEHGAWFTGGYCNRTQPLSESDASLSGSTSELRKIQLEEIGRVREGGREGKRKFGLLDVTRAMMVRADGHPGSHWNRKSINDCLHWCLPGPIDTWNDLLLQILKKESLL